MRIEPAYMEVTDGSEKRLTATVIDDAGRPFEELPEWIWIEWRSSDTAVAEVSDSGMVTAERPGAVAVTAVVWMADADSTGTGEEPGGVGEPGPTGGSVVLVRSRAEELNYVAGSGQSGTVGGRLPDSLVVRAVDDQGEGVEEVPVAFVVMTGDGWISPGMVETDSEGYARTEWRLGPEEGEQELEARVPGVAGSPITFVATAGPSAVARVELDADSVELSAIGDAAGLGAQAYDEAGEALAGEEYVWTSSDSTIASVDDHGVVEARGRGRTWIVVTAGAASDTATVVVDPAVATVDVIPAADTLVAGDTVQLTATASDGNGHEIADASFEWASEDSMIARVDTTGRVVAREPGTVDITATSGGKSGVAAITVASSLQEVARVEISPAEDTLDALGATLELSAAAYAADGGLVAGAAIEWTSLDTDVVTVDETGAVVAHSVGRALVVALSTCCLAADTAAIEVRQVVAEVAVTPDGATVEEGATASLSAAAADANGHAIPDATFDWSSSNEGVATIDGSGVVTGVAEGTASIVAASAPSADTVTVTVEAGDDPPVGGGEGGPNEPAGFDPVFYMDGTTKDWGGQFSYGRKWGDRTEGSTGPFSGRVSVVNDGSAPNGKAVQVEWRAGDASGFAGAAFWNDWTGSVGRLREIYIKVIVKYSDNWDQHDSGTTKLFYYGAGSGAATEFYPQMNSGPKPGLLRWRDQSGSGDDGVFQAEDDGAFSAGRYHMLEIHHVAQSSSGASDGSVRVWIDGKEIDSWDWLGGNGSTRLSEPRFSWLGNESEVRFTGVQLGSYWGGSRDTKDVNDWMRWGEIYISGKK